MRVDREGFVHRREHGGHRAEGQVEAQVLEAILGRFRPVSPEAAVVLEGVGRRALEGVDGLLRVADREQGSLRAAARAVAGGELLGEAAQDRPLGRVDVLRLVQKDVVDAAVELVEEPARVAALQESQRPGDQVVEVQRAPTRFRFLDPGADFRAQDQEGAGALRGEGGAATLLQRRDPALLGEQRVPQG
jgi:hypothetical protein